METGKVAVTVEQSIIVANLFYPARRPAIMILVVNINIIPAKQRLDTITIPHRNVNLKSSQR